MLHLHGVLAKSNAGSAGAIFASAAHVVERCGASRSCEAVILDNESALYYLDSLIER